MHYCKSFAAFNGALSCKLLTSFHGKVLYTL